MSVLSEKSFDPDGMDPVQSEASYDPEGRQTLESEKSFDPDCSDEEDEEAVLVPPPAAQSRDAWEDDNSSEKSFDASEESFDPDEILPPEADEPQRRNQQVLEEPRANCTEELPVETRGQEDDALVEELRAREAAAKSDLDVGSPTSETQTLSPQSSPQCDPYLDTHHTLHGASLTPPNPESFHPDTSRMRCRSLEQCMPWPVLWVRLSSLISPTSPKSSPMRGRGCAWTRRQV